MNPPSLLPTFRAAIMGVFFAAHAALAVEHGRDWPCFQGPLGNGSSPETGLLREWPKDGPPVVWKAKIGQGWSQPTIVGDSVFVCWTENVNGAGEATVCLDAK